MTRAVSARRLHTSAESAGTPGRRSRFPGWRDRILGPRSRRRPGRVREPHILRTARPVGLPRRRPGSRRPMSLWISQTVIEARPIPSAATRSKNSATRGSGLARIISETTFVSSSHPMCGFSSRTRRKRGVAGSRDARAGELHPVSWSEVSHKRPGGLQTALRLSTLLVDQAANKLLHRDTGSTGLALGPGLVARVDAANGDGAHRRPSSSVSPRSAGPHLMLPLIAINAGAPEADSPVPTDEGARH